MNEQINQDIAQPGAWRFLFDIENTLLYETYVVGVALVIAIFAIQLPGDKRQVGGAAPSE